MLALVAVHGEGVGPAEAVAAAVGREATFLLRWHVCVDICIELVFVFSEIAQFTILCKKIKLDFVWFFFL